jgi:hypothetical protein
MSNKIVITLTNGFLDRDIYFDLIENNISNRWFSVLEKSCSQIRECDRFTNWPETYKNINFFISELNSQIDIINKYDNCVYHRLTEDSSQEQMNILHRYFENLRGERNTGTPWYNTAPDYVKSAVDRFNILIHEYEQFLRKNKILYSPVIVCTFKDPARYELLDLDYDLFTYRWTFGTLYINYSEVGKNLLEVFKDNDNIVGDENIRPQRFWNADFMIKFGIDTPRIYYYIRKLFFTVWRIRHPIIKKIPKNKLSVGLIPVAQFNKIESNLDFSKRKIVKELSKFNRIKKIKCIK